MSYAKSVIRAETVKQWQQCYDTSDMGAVTRVFFPKVEKAHRVVKKTRLSPVHVQVLTGQGGFAEYLHRFKIKSSPACACDPDTDETVTHLLIHCPRFGSSRFDLETKMGIQLDLDTLPKLLADNNTRQRLLDYMEQIAIIAAKRNK